MGRAISTTRKEYGMTATLDPRLAADTLGVSTLDLATFLREKASDLMVEASKIALNEPWYSHEDASQRGADLDDLVERAKRLMQGGFECDRAFSEDNPIEDDQ